MHWHCSSIDPWWHQAIQIKTLQYTTMKIYKLLIRHFEKYLHTMMLKLAEHVGITIFLLNKQKTRWNSDIQNFYSEIWEKGDTAAVSGSWKLPLPAPATTVAKNQCLTCCLTCCFWCWISHWVLLILSWNMWLRGRSGGLWLGRDPGGVGGSVKIGDWVFWSCWSLSPDCGLLDWLFGCLF